MIKTSLPPYPPEIEKNLNWLERIILAREESAFACKLFGMIRTKARKSVWGNLSK